MEKQSESEEASLDSSTSSQHHQNWIAAQDFLRTKLITDDRFTWKLSTPTSTSRQAADSKEEQGASEVLRYVGGVDISFSKDDPSMACGTLVVLDFHTLKVVYEDFSLVAVHVPYVPGFLAFREAPVLLELLEKMKKSNNPSYPQAMRSTEGSVKPIFISIGHRISLPTAITIVQMTCKYRVPEPIRQADIRSRDYIRKVQMNARTMKLH